LPTSKDLPSSLVQLRIAVWTGVTRDTGPIAAISRPIALRCEICRVGSRRGLHGLDQAMAQPNRRASQSASPLNGVDRPRTRPPFTRLAGPSLPSRPGEFHPESLTEPDLILSHHPARAIARRLPPSAESSGSSRILPSWPMFNGDDPPPSLRGHYPASSLLRGSPPLSGASVLSASQLEPLVLFPLASPARFSRSVPEPD